MLEGSVFFFLLVFALSAIVIYLTLLKYRRMNDMEQNAQDLERIGESNYVFSNEYMEQMNKARGRLFSLPNAQGERRKSHFY